MWNGIPFNKIVEGDIVIQDGLGACGTFDFTYLSEVFTHELGHANGMGHSCGDQSTGSCTGRSIQNAAVMRASAHGTIGAVLSQDDRAGIYYLYCTSAPCNPGNATSVPGGDTGDSGSSASLAGISSYIPISPEATNPSFWETFFKDPLKSSVSVWVTVAIVGAALLCCIILCVCCCCSN